MSLRPRPHPDPTSALRCEPHQARRLPQAPLQAQEEQAAEEADGTHEAKRNPTADTAAPRPTRRCPSCRELKLAGHTPRGKVE